LNRKPAGTEPGRCGVALYLAAAETCDRIECAGERRTGDALAPVPVADEMQAIRQFGKVVKLFS
jgi:hypothetical protein